VGGYAGAQQAPARLAAAIAAPQPNYDGIFV